MAIYPDKKNGQLTGRFRVELQKGQERFRRRCDSLQEAKEVEAAVQRDWESRQDHTVAGGAVRGSSGHHTFASTIVEAKGVLWRGKSTEDTCWAHVEAIARILGEKTRLDAVDTGSVRKVNRYLVAQGKSDATINRYLSHLRTFLVWALGEKHRTIPINKDTIDFEWHTESSGRIRWITVEEEQRLQELLPDNVWKLVKVAIETGCRRDELLTAKLDQINGTLLHLWKTKTNHARTVPMTQETTTMLTELIEQGTMPTRRGLRSWWNRARDKMGLKDDADFVFHATRHTRASRMVDAGINAFVIKEWLGHKRIETTLRYAQVKPQNLEAALVTMGDYERGNPINSSNSNAMMAPHSSPTGAGNGQIRAAA